MAAHFFQTEAWARFQRALGRRVIRGENSNEGYSYTGIISENGFYKWLYVPYGPYVYKEESLTKAVVDIGMQAKKNRLDFIHIEPSGMVYEMDKYLFDETSSGLKHAAPILPQKTHICNLEKYDINFTSQLEAYVDNGIEFSVSYEPKDIDSFISLLKEKNGEKTDKYFRVMADTLFEKGSSGLFFAKSRGEVKASILFFQDRDMLYYFHDTADISKKDEMTEVRTLEYNKCLLQYCIEFAISEKCKKIDFCSNDISFLADDILTEVYTYFGSYVLPLNVVKWQLYKRSMKDNRKHDSNKVNPPKHF